MEAARISVIWTASKKDVEITAIVTVADDGVLGNFENIHQLTHQVTCEMQLVAMSDMPAFMKKVFQYCLQKKIPLAANSLGIYYCRISEMQGSTYNAMQLLTKFSIRQEKSILLVIHH